MPNFYNLPKAGTVKQGEAETAFFALSAVAQGYIQALFWLETEPGTTAAERKRAPKRWARAVEEGQQKDIPGDYGFRNLAPRTLEEIVADCAAFSKAADRFLTLAAAQGYTDEQAGIDFWLTRNGHGAGFRDRDALAGPAPGSSDSLGEVLTNMVGFGTEFDTVDAYVGDDGLVYLS